MTDERHTLQLTIISDLQQFSSLQSAWKHLNDHARSGTVFLSWEWHFSWWQMYARDSDRLRILCVTHNQKLVGLIPLYCRRSGLPWQGRSLRFTGTGEPRGDEVASEYLDVLALPKFEQQVADLVLNWMLSFESWRDVTFNCLLEGSALLDAIARSPAKPHLLKLPVGFRYRVLLGEGEAGHFMRMGPSRVKRISRSVNAAKKAGGVRYESVDSVLDLENSLRELANLSHERQIYAHRKSVFASPIFTRFHQQLAERLYPMGGCDVHKLFVGHRLMAMLYCFYDRHTCYYYQSGFVRREANRYQPLTLAHLEEMKRNRETGRSYYDLMRGDPPCYKDDFGCETTPMETLMLFRGARDKAQFELVRRRRQQLVRLLKKAGVERRHG